MCISFTSQTNVLCGWVSVHGVHVLVSYPFPVQDYISQSLSSKQPSLDTRLCVYVYMLRSFESQTQPTPGWIAFSITHAESNPRCEIMHCMVSLTRQPHHFMILKAIWAGGWLGLACKTNASLISLMPRLLLFQEVQSGKETSMEHAHAYMCA